MSQVFETLSPLTINNVERFTVQAYDFSADTLFHQRWMDLAETSEIKD